MLEFYDLTRKYRKNADALVNNLYVLNNHFHEFLIIFLIC